MNNRTAIFLFAVLTLFLFGTSVSAGKAPSGAAATAVSSAAADQPDLCLTDEKCKEFYDIARRQSEAGQFEAALSNYQNAYARKPAPWILINIGRICHKLQRFQAAIDNYQKYLDLPDSETEAELRTTAERYNQEARQEMEKETDPRPMTPQAQPSQPVATAAASRSAEHRPLYKKWWFWTLLGGVAAAGVVAGVAGGVVSSQQLPSPVLRPF